MRRRKLPQMGRALFHIRPTIRKDYDYLVMMSQGQEIGVPPNFDEGGFCAVNHEDVPVGYIHVQQTEKGPHVAPVVVFQNWHGHNVGTALVKRAFEKFGPLKLVSNGSSNGFYEKLGFVPVEWEQIEPEFQRDCLSCKYYEQCGPKPYMLEEWKL